MKRFRNDAGYLTEIRTEQRFTHEYFRNNWRFHDGPNGEPAYQRWNENDDHLATVEYYCHGKLQDGQKGEPAQTIFYNSGKVKSKHRYADGVRQDGEKGEPAIEEFNEWGICVLKVHMIDGVRQDSPSGEPAFQRFNDFGHALRAANRCVTPT